MTRAPSRRRRKIDVKEGIADGSLPAHTATRGFKFEEKIGHLCPEGSEYEKHRFPWLKVRHYTPDFRLPNGRFVEVKGGSGPMGITSISRSAIKHARIQNEELRDIIVVLRYPNSKCTSKLNQREWFESTGITVMTEEEFKTYLETLT